MTMGLLVVIVVLFALGSLLFAIGAVILRARQNDRQQHKVAQRALDREEAQARKNAPWRLEIEGNYSEGISFTAKRKWWDSQHPAGMVEGRSIELGEVEPDDDLVKFREAFEAKRYEAEQIVVGLESSRNSQGMIS